MTDKVYIVTDLGPGDGGKGGVVHKVATMMNAHTVIKVGGAQGSHGVSTTQGENFAFSQWGCGTFEGTPTHLSSRMIVSPEGLLNEADTLRYQHGVHNAFDLLTVDRNALCATPYHGIASRLKEMARGENPRGTIGTGVGEAYRDLARFPDHAIRAGDLVRPDLADRLAAVRRHVQTDLEEILEGEFLPTDEETAAREAELLRDDAFLDYIVTRFQEAAKQTNIVASDFLAEEVLQRKGVAVVESSHGILTDHFRGFHPHTSAIRTLPCFNHELLQSAGFSGEIVDIGVHRAYTIRHGAGPMPTADPTMTEQLLPGSHKDENRYQGKVRVGPLDLVLLRYAIEACGGPTAFDGLAITWFDQIQANGEWHVCDRYQGNLPAEYFISEGKIIVHKDDDARQLAHQEALGKLVAGCVPEVQALGIPSEARSEELFSLCAETIQKGVGVPVRMVSFGPTERDSLCK